MMKQEFLHSHIKTNQTLIYTTISWLWGIDSFQHAKEAVDVTLACYDDKRIETRKCSLPFCLRLRFSSIS